MLQIFRKKWVLGILGTCIYSKTVAKSWEMVYSVSNEMWLIIFCFMRLVVTQYAFLWSLCTRLWFQKYMYCLSWMDHLRPYWFFCILLSGTSASPVTPFSSQCMHTIQGTIQVAKIWFFLVLEKEVKWATKAVVYWFVFYLNSPAYCWIPYFYIAFSIIFSKVAHKRLV